MTDDRRTRIETYDFRAFAPHLRFGTASDRYGGWIGQVYPEDAYPVDNRTRRLGGRTFQEEKLPIASVRDYFEHFGVLEIDFTFYRPLRDPDGSPAGSSFFPLQQYAEYAPADATFLLKAPQAYFARTLRRGGNFVSNPDFLDAEVFERRFYEPARELLGDRLQGFVFQQEYQRVSDGPAPDENVEALDEFFRQIPTDVQPHLELRSDHLLTDPYFDWLAERGLGFVFSHWTWLPPIREQWQRCGGRFTAADGSVVARLLTPRDVKYADAYARAHPFDRPVAALCETPQAHDMVLDATALAFQAEAQNALLNLVCNNRAWGNAPELARTIAGRILDEEQRRAAR